MHITNSFSLQGEFSINSPLKEPNFLFHFDTLSMQIVKKDGGFRLASVELQKNQVIPQKDFHFLWKAQYGGKEELDAAGTWIVNSILPLFQRVFVGDTLTRDDLCDVISSNKNPQLFSLGQICPYGTTCSYTDLTLLLGYPKTHVRYVARMLATNPYAVLIPCHRVVHKHQRSLIRYRWGSEIKIALQEYERRCKCAF